MDAIPPDMDPSTIPLMPNPSGAPPNFENPPDLVDTVLGVGVMLIALSLVFLGCRLGTNLKLQRKLGLDDYLCIFAQAGGITYWALVYSVSRLGVSRHGWDIPITAFSVLLIRLQFILQIVVAPTLWAAKSAILALYLRVFGKVTWLRVSCYISIVLMALFYGMNIVVAIVYCVPRSGESWDGNALPRCGNSAWSAVAIGVFSLVADLVILLLPFPIVIRLQMTSVRKITLSVVFATGAILVVLSAVSLYLRVRIFVASDPTWNGIVLAIVTFAEIFGTIIVSCAPAISAFCNKILTGSTLWSRIMSSQNSLKSEKTQSEHSSSHPPADPVTDFNANTKSAGQYSMSSTASRDGDE